MPTEPLRNARPNEETAIPSDIHPWIRLAFEALLSGSGSYGLMPCLVGGEPSAAIVMGHEVADGIEVMPLFVAIIPAIGLKLPRRSGRSSHSPARGEVARAFAVNKNSLSRA